MTMMPNIKALAEAELAIDADTGGGYWPMRGVLGASVILACWRSG